MVLTALIWIMVGLSLSSESNALEIDPAFIDTTCIPPTPDPKFNTTWFSSVPQWYIPLWSKGEVYTFLKVFLSPKELAQLKDNELANFCPVARFGKGKLVIKGFGERVFTQEYLLNPLRPGVMDSAVNGEYVGTSFLVLTDNKSFVVGVDVFPDGVTGFFVISIKKRMDPQQLTEIANTLVPMGFDPQQFFHFSYANCTKRSKYMGDFSNYL